MHLCTAIHCSPQPFMGAKTLINLAYMLASLRNEVFQGLVASVIRIRMHFCEIVLQGAAQRGGGVEFNSFLWLSRPSKMSLSTLRLAPL